MIGRVFSIEEFSTFDGPGIRTTVFLKGCPLRCVWCHNPEGQLFEHQIIKSPNGCLHCGACLDCGERLTGERKLVKESIAVCPRNLIRECAVDDTVQELCNRILQNTEMFQKTGGGVTFSGGEPLAQYDFLWECLRFIGSKTNRALQTSGFCEEEKFGGILEHLDYVLFDLKLIDEKKHIQYTGASNRLIIKNFETLCNSKIPFCIRTPLIPTITDTKENMEAIGSLLKQYNVCYIELLPYNKMAGSKYKLVDKVYNPPFDERIPVETQKEILEQYGITVNVL
ncbi:MAG: glycyl-radical enzyme activating protein family [Herbinix sp.]|jgi:pyruvate formate lyase activating enzyme|nr:glycyl-radical enzyme activating protein family [Herbinix sp.]